MRSRKTVLVGAALAASITGALYIWSVFSAQIASGDGWSMTDVTLAYSLFLAAEGTFSIVCGFLQRRVSARVLTAIGGLFLSGGWFLASFAQTPLQLYGLFSLVGGIGSGVVYNASLSLVAKWFPDKRGTANGVCVALVGVTPFLFSPLSETLIGNFGVATAFRVCGLAFFCVFVVAVALIADPPEDWDPESAQNNAKNPTQNLAQTPAQSSFEKTIAGRPSEPRELTTGQALRTPMFYVMWVLFALSTASGLMVTGVASDLGQVMAGLSSSEAALVTGLIPAASIVGRFFFGALSDRVGRYVSWAAALVVTIIAMAVLFPLAHGLAMFSAAGVLAGFSFGGFMALLPALCGDAFGNRNFGSNYALVFTAFSVASVIGPLVASVTVEQTGTYLVSYFIAGGFALVALAIVPLTRRFENVSKGRFV